jgi:hypothetical protein
MLLTIALLLVAGTLSATVLLPAEFREIVAGAEIIVHARVVDVRPQWVDGRRRIESVVTIEVLTPFKGGNQRTIVFKVPGGQIGRYRSMMVGAPSFRQGDEAVLFLNARGAEVPWVFGLNQGVFRVRLEPGSGRRVVLPPGLMASGDSPQRARRGSAARRPLQLEAFGAQLRAVMAQQGAAR